MNLRSLLPALLAALVLAPLPASAEQPDTVIMQLDEFLSMYESSQEKDDPPQVAPREYTVSSARYTGEVILDDGEPASALFKATLGVEVLKSKGWVQVPLLPGTVALRSARVGGKEAAVTSDGSWLYLVTDRKGAFDVDLVFATTVFTAEGRSSLSFQPTPAGAVEVELRVPVEDALDFTVAGAKLQSDRTERGVRIVEAILPGTSSLAVSWQREIPETVEQEEPRVYAEVFSLVGLGDGLLQSSTTIAYTILQAGVDEFTVAIPEGTTLIDAQGSGIRDWTLADDGTLTVTLNYAAEGSYRLVLQLEQATGEGNMEVSAPLPIPLAVDRSKGWVGVEARGALEIEGGETAGVTPIDVRTLPGAILGITSNPVLLAYKYLGSEASLPLRVTQHEDVAVLVTLLDRAEATTMFTVDGRRLTSISYRVRNNRKQFLRLAIPEGAELWSASVAGKAVQPARAVDGRILIPLIRSQASGGALASFEVGVVYVESGDAPSKDGKGSFRATMPTADVPVTYVAWTVYAPWQAKVKKKSLDGSLRSVAGLSRPFDRGDLAAIQANAPTSGYDVYQGAQAQMDGGGMGSGATPVAVNVPLEGRPLYFEKLLALGEELWIGFDYKGLK
jgi:hypothetical protein